MQFPSGEMTHHAGLPSTRDPSQQPDVHGSSQSQLPPSTTPFIPTELLVIIFEWYGALCCTFRAEAPTDSAWPLGLVCRRWRMLALSLPHLWNHLPILRITKKTVRSAGFIEKWKLFVDRSGNLPLRLHLSFDISPYDISKSPYLALSPFFACSQRWEHVTISNIMVMQTQLQFQAVRGKLGLLHSLTFNFAETTFDVTDNNTFNIFEFAPNLTTILLHSPSHRHWKSRLLFPWRQLTTYKEAGIDMGTFPIVLGLSPHLEALHYQGRNFICHSTHPIYHIYLRHLFVDTGSLRVFFEQLERLTIPSLETLSVIVRDNQPVTFSTSAVTHFLIRSGCSLRKLVVSLGHEAIQHDLLNLFLLTPDLEFLELGSCHTPFLQDMVLQRLVYDKYSPTLLPRLRSLTLNYCEDPERDDIALVSNIVSSRQETAISDSPLGQLYAVLDRVRIITSDVYSRFRILCQLGDWEDPISTFNSYTQPLPGTVVTSIDIADHIVALTERTERCRIDGALPVSLAPELLSIFTLAHLTDDSFEQETSFELLENLGVFPLAKSYFIQRRWIPGCKSDILYIPRILDQNTLTDVWTHVANRNAKVLDMMLGYEAHQEREDDLVKAIYSKYWYSAWQVALIFLFDKLN
ncbi:hypothetical protein D9756_010102 [Leucocoprinus leucothites]|uniref:F-box domain-containing protein n=1 Tax=Leucocoprinus leucothites TaxID=201217 RepID=A0A8H5CR72_9AGAR|nr:hypothetical protein D9756_010102 [Leucoagaricus leucothites]